MQAKSLSKKFFILSLFIALVFALLMPTRVLADDETPPTEIPASEVVTTPEPISTEQPLATPEDVPTIVPNDPVATDEPAVEPALIETQPATLPEIVDSLADANAVVLDENGNPIPLVSQEVADALLSGDPIGCPPGVEPVSWGGTGAGCTGSYSSIQSAIDDVLVTSGWTVYIDAGTFAENIVIDKSITLQGAGQGLTIIVPGVSNPNCGGAGGGSLCAGGSNVILVQASNVTILDLTINGNNPLLTSGVVVNGEDVDARNGIITDHTAGVFNNLEIGNVTVENVYLRGIYASSGGTFNIHDNTVDNVAGNYASIAIFNFGGSGVISNNVVSNANDAISANWSTGTQFLNNTITNSGSGIHTDNTQASDVISGNTITNGSANSYGIFVFAPYAPVTVSDNTISNVDYGLALAGNGWGDSLNTVTFDNNEVTANVAGAYVTTDVWGYFFSDASASFTNNVFTGGDYGFYLESNGDGEYYSSANYDCSGAGGDCVLNVTGSNNSITGQNVFAASIAAGQPNWVDDAPAFYGEYNVDLTGNWWGDASGPQDASVVPDACGSTLDNPAGLGGDVSECILYDSWLTEDPFLTPPADGDNDDDEPKVPIIPPVVPPGIPPLIPVTGGQTIEISCNFPSTTTVLSNSIQIVLSGLCGYSAIADEVMEGGLSDPIPDGSKFASGLSLAILKDGNMPVGDLPDKASVVLSFPIPAGSMEGKLLSVIFWDAADGKWVAQTVSTVGGRVDLSVDTPGIYVLVTK